MIAPIGLDYHCWPPEKMFWTALAPRVADREYPWDSEVDADGRNLMVYMWTTQSGAAAYAARDPHLGCWGGYVAIGPGHTLHGRGVLPPENTPVDGIGEPRLLDIPAGIHSSVHDGIKYAGPIPTLDPDDVGLWWLGFRCDGDLDYTPGYDFWNDPHVDYYDSTWPDALDGQGAGGRRTYRTLEYVQSVAEGFAAELTRSNRPMPIAGQRVQAS